MGYIKQKSKRQQGQLHVHKTKGNGEDRLKDISAPGWNFGASRTPWIHLIPAVAVLFWQRGLAQNTV